MPAARAAMDLSPTFRCCSVAYCTAQADMSCACTGKLMIALEKLAVAYLSFSENSINTKSEFGLTIASKHCDAVLDVMPPIAELPIWTYRHRPHYRLLGA